MANVSSTRLRSALGVGLAFIVGSVVFVAAFTLLNRWRIIHEPLDLPNQRIAGALEIPLLRLTDTAEPQVWRLKDQAGKVVLVNYFATWCGPCNEELPDLKLLAAEFQPRGVVFVAVSLDAPGDRSRPQPVEPLLRQFAQDRNLPFPILLPSADSTFMRASPIPQTFLYDRQGRKARSILGEISNRDVKASLEELLKEP